MKKLFTVIALATAVLSVNARTLWTGTCTFANYQVESGDRPVFNPTDFSDAVIGDKIIISLTNYENDPQSWHQVEIWQYDGEKPGPAALGTGVHILPGMTSAEFTIDETFMQGLLAGPTCLAGTGYTVRNIELTTFDGIVWEGECMCPDWVPSPAVTLPGSKFATAQEGDHLVFTVEKLIEGSWAAIQIDRATTFSAGPFGTVEIADGQTSIDIVLTSDLLASLLTDGINITGANFKLTKIELVKGNGEVPPVEENVVWSGSEVIDNWSNSFTVPATKFGNVQAGNILVFTVSNVSGDDPQFCLKSNLPEGWGEMPSDIEGGFGNYIHVADGDGVYYFDINAAAASLINEYGFTVAGPGICTITKIELIEEAVVEDAIWSGTMTAGDWENWLTIEADKFADIEAGDILRFTVTNVAAENWLSIKQNLPEGWGVMPADEDAASEFALTEGDGDYNFVVNAEAAASIKEYGLVVAGFGFTLTKVAYADRNGVAAISVDAPVDNAVYNLRGIKVADSINGVNTPGIYISGGKKYILK